MEKAVKLLLLLILLPGLGFSQQIASFDDLVDELQEQTSYSLSYPQTIAQYPIHGGEEIDISDLESLRELLRKSGIRMTSRKKVLIFKALKSTPISKASLPLQITGYVRDAESGESLIGAHVIDTQTGAGVSTNVYGFFSLTVVGDSLEIGFVGYERSKIPVKGDGKELIIELGISEQLLDEVTITDHREIQEINRMSTANLAPRQIKSMPVFMGESDLLKALQLLPGVQSGGEGTSGLYVRGGGPDQNLILLDGVPVYNANHLYGFFSVFNTDALNSVKLIKGGFPARYGGRLSSVIDIQMKEGNLNKVEGEGAIGLIASKMTLSGPIRKGKTSYMISGRRTYLDLFVVPIAKATGARPITGYYFWDLNTKINHVISSRDRIYLSAYMGRDRFYEIFKNNPEPQFEEKEKSNLRWGNITTSFRWNHKFSDRLFSNLTAIMAHYKFKLDSRIDFRSLGEDSTHIFRKNSYFSSISDVGIKYDFNYYLNNQNQVRFGANLVQHRFEPGISAYESLAQSDTTFGANLIHLLEYYAYVEDDITLTSSTKLNMGMHYSGAQVNGTTYHSFQPRLTFTQKLAPKWSLKASYADMVQYIHLLVNSGVGLPTDLWVPSTEKVKPQTSRQYALGLATTQKDLAISVETYYKEMNNLIEYKDGAGFLDVVNEWEDKLEFGKGKSYGVEVLVRKDVGRSTGWVGYTWSKTDRSFPNLNYGQTFPYRYDRRHDLSVVYNLKINNRIAFGAVWVFGTGNAITLPTASYPKAVWDTAGPNYEETSKHYPGRNSSRMRDYHRLDLNISFSKKKKWGERKWVFGVYNAYSRLNPVFIDFENSVTDTGTGRFKQLSLFPIIPNVSYQFKILVMNKYIIYILLILAVSCETPVTPDLPDDNDQVVVYSFIRPGQPMKFDVYRTTSIMESPVPQRLRGLVIELYQNGQLIESIPDENFESYTSSSLAQTGQSYQFRIESVYGLVTGETTVPRPVQIESATYSTEVIDINLGEFGYPASITFSDPGNELNYYALEVFVDQCEGGCEETELSGELNELLIEDVKVNTSGNTDITISSGPDGIDGLSYIYFSDNGLNGDQFTLDFYIIPTLIDPDNLENIKIQYILKSITEDYYDYLISSDYQKQIEEEGVLTEPVQVFTNIQNGLGVFSGYNVSMLQPKDIE